MLTVKTASRDTLEAGLTIIELLIVIAIIGILASLSFSIVSAYRYAGEDAERTSDVESIARAFEISYLRDASAAGASYPNTVRATDVAHYDSLFQGQSLDSTKAPETANTTSIVAATTNTQPQSPALDQYLYLPLTATGALCSGTEPCVKFILYYRLEDNGSLKTVESIRQQ